MAAFDSVGNAGGVTIATTSDGGMTWRVAPAPATWRNQPTAWSCAADTTSWTATSQASSTGLPGPVIEATTDGGRPGAPRHFICRWQAPAHH